MDGEPIATPNFWSGVPLYAGLSAGQGAPTTTSRNGVSSVSDAANYAMFLVQIHGLVELNEAHSTKVTAAQTAEVRTTLLASQGGAIYKKLPGWFLDQLVEAQANFQALIAYYAKDVDANQQIEAYYKANQSQFQQLCMDVIGGDETELNAARSRLDEGSDFATVAKAVAAAQPADATGQKPQALGAKGDGDVGCVPMSTIQNLFADPAVAKTLVDAKPGSLIGPLPVAGGTFMLFRVRSQTVEPLAQAKPTIVQAIGQPGQDQAQKALNGFLAKADIQLNPRIGHWKKGVGYTPPVGAEQPAGAATTTLPGGALTG